MTENNSVFFFTFLFIALFDAIEKGEEDAVKFYNAWVAEVKATVPKDKLLVFEAKDGWGPLCEFLNVPMPEGPFPHVNDTASINENFNSLKIQSKLVFIVLPVFLSIAGVLIYTKMST